MSALNEKTPAPQINTSKTKASWGISHEKYKHLKGRNDQSTFKLEDCTAPLRAARQAKREQSKPEQLGSALPLPSSTFLEMRKKRNEELLKKKHNAIGFLSRREKKPKIPENNLTTDHLNHNKAISIYNKKHNCSCTSGRKCNIAKTSGKDYVFTCNHKQSKLTLAHAEGKCDYCGAKRGKQFISPCNCTYFECDRCKYSTFRYSETQHQFFDKHSHGNNLTVSIVQEKTVTFEVIAPKNAPKESPEMKVFLMSDHSVKADFPKMVTPYKPKESRRDFLNSLKYQGPAKPTYSKIASTPQSGFPEKPEPGDLGRPIKLYCTGYSVESVTATFRKLNLLNIKQDSIKQILIDKCNELFKPYNHVSISALKYESLEKFREFNEDAVDIIEGIIAQARNVRNRLRRGKNLNPEEEEMLNQDFPFEIIDLDKIFKEIPVLSEPQGGAVSTAIGAVASSSAAAVEIVKKRFTEMKDNLEVKISDFNAMRRTVNFLGESWEQVTDMFDYARHLMNIIYDYLDPIIIGDFISLAISCSNGMSWKTSAEFLRLAINLRTLENSSKKLCLMYGKIISQGGQAPEINLGVFDYVVKRYVSENQFKLTTFKRFVMNLGFASIDFSESSCDMIKHLLDYATVGFRKINLTVISELARRLTPLFTLPLVTLNLGKRIIEVFTGMCSYIMGTSQSPQEWFSDQLTSESSPIFELYVSYLTYKTNLIEKITTNYNQLREDFYLKKTLADAYVHKMKKFSSAYSNFVNYLQSGMAETPTATQRDFEPATIAIHGAPGCGKSTWWPVIISQAIDCKDPKEIMNLTYTWKTDTEYTPGLSKAKVILYDDLGQDKTTSIEALSIINLVTSAPYMINSANIVGTEIKGMFAQPEVIVACTNDPDMGSELLRDKAALMRRFDIRVKMNDKIDPEADMHQQRVFEIVSCPRYASMIGQNVDLFTLTTLFGMLNSLRKKEFKNLNTKKEEIYREAQTKAIVHSSTNMQEIGKEPFWQRNGPVNKDLEEYLRSRETPVKKDVEENGNINITELKQIIVNALIVGSAFIGPMSVAVSIMEFIRGVKDTIDYVGIVNKKAILKNWLRTMAKVVIIPALGIFTGYSLYKTFSSKEESGTTKTSKPLARAMNVPSSQESGNVEQILPIIKRATGVLRMNNGNQVNCIFVGGQFILTVRHFFSDFAREKGFVEDGTQIYVTKNGWNQTKTIIFEKKRIREFKLPKGQFDETVRNDVVLYELDKTYFSAEKNITHFFWDGTASTMNYKVCRVDYYGTEKIHDISKIEDYSTEVHSGTVINDKRLTPRIKGGETYYHVCAEATYMPRPSSCGTAVFVNDSRICAPILGIHIAASHNGNSLFHYVTRESLETLMKRTLDIEEQGLVYVEGKPNYLPHEHKLEFIGQITKPPFQNQKTDLRPSLVYECVSKHTTEPSALSFNDPRLPSKDLIPTLFEAYSLITDFKEFEIREAVESLKQEDFNLMRKSKVPSKILNHEEVLNGLPEYEGSTSIPMNTSCGYPYMVEGLNKEKLITRSDKLSFGSRLLGDYELAEKQIQNGIVPFLPFVLSIKDERVKLEKIYEKPKSRLFANGNLIHFLISRKYLFTHMLAYYQDSERTFATIGVDRLSLQWHEVISYLREVGFQGFDGDYKNWDRSISRLLMRASFEIMINSVKHLIEPLEMETLMELFSTHYYIFGYDLYRSDGTLPSGMLTTYNQNCIINEILHRSAYLSIMRKMDPINASIKVYREKTRGKRGGDDTVQVVHESIAPNFNGKTFGKWLTERGMKYTMGDKSEILIPLMDITELSFLKNKTRLWRGLYVPLPDENSLIEMTYWVRINKDNQDILKATEDNCNAALRGFYFHGQTKFDQIRDEMIKMEPRLNLFTFQDLACIWEKYYHFPGSHADYVTKMDQLGNNEQSAERFKARLLVIINENEPTRPNTNKHREETPQSWSGNNDFLENSGGSTNTRSLFFGEEIYRKSRHVSAGDSGTH